MAKQSLQVLAALALALCAGHVAALNMDHRILLLSRPGFRNTDFIENTLQEARMPYDLVRIRTSNAASLASNEFWYNADGSARYSGIFMTPSFEGHGALNREQVVTMHRYMNTTHVRMVQIAAWDTNYGYHLGNLTNGKPACSSTAAIAKFETTLVDSTFVAAGINKAVKLYMDGLYRCPGTVPSGWCGIWASDFAHDGLGGPCAVSPVLRLPAEPGTVDFPGPATSAWVVYTNDSRELLVMSHDCAAWSSACMIFGKYALAWLVEGVSSRSGIALNTNVTGIGSPPDTCAEGAELADGSCPITQGPSIGTSTGTGTGTPGGPPATSPSVVSITDGTGTGAPPPPSAAAGMAHVPLASVVLFTILSGLVVF